MKVVFSNPNDVESNQVDIADIVHRSLESVEELRTSAHVSVSVEIDPEAAHVRFSDMHLKQVLVNLLRNSFRALAASDRGEPTVAVRTRSVDGRIRIEVEDNGPGISSELRDRVFDPFYSTADRSENMGLGLYVVHTLLKAFSFSIRVEDGSGGGARFVIEEERE
jgi:C4-dicarboxylate-specific signal transduction histidine kinase